MTSPRRWPSFGGAWASTHGTNRDKADRILGERIRELDPNRCSSEFGDGAIASALKRVGYLDQFVTVRSASDLEDAWPAAAAETNDARCTRRSLAPVGVDIEDVRRLATPLPRAYEVLVRDRVKLRVGRIVWLAFSRDETLMGFAFPKEERDALVASEPLKFLLPRAGDLRYHWVVVRLAAIDLDELTEIVHDAWRMVVPRRVALEHLGA